jgi:recombination protein RecA
MSKSLRKLAGVLAKSNCTVIFINQLREKVGVMYGNPETTTGGRALKFYSTIRIEIRRSETIKQGDKALGNIVNVKVVKNKVAPPYRSCKVELMFGEGVSKDHEVAQLAVDYSIIEKSGSWFSYQGERLGQGITSVYDWLKNNPDMQVKIEEEVRARLSDKTPETDAE